MNSTAAGNSSALSGVCGRNAHSMARSHQPDLLFIASLTALCLFGLLMLFSASAVSSFQKFGDSTYLFKQQSVSFLIGIAAFLFFFRVDFRFWKKIAWPLLLVSLGLLIAVLIPGIGTTILGARRWISLGGFLFQPTEIIKFTFLLYLASWLEKRDLRHRATDHLVPFLIMLGVIIFLVMAQPDLGTVTVIVTSGVVTYFIAGAPWRHFAWIAGAGATLLTLFIAVAPYRAARLTSFLNPGFEPQGIGYHIRQALLAIGAGGIWGLGLGHSRQKYNFLPAAESDSIFAVIAEELGFLVVLCFLALLVFFILRGFSIARRAPDGFSRLFAAGISTWFAFQAFINIGALTGIIPLTGIPLPFISFGGSALVISLAAAGTLANISKQTSA